MTKPTTLPEPAAELLKRTHRILDEFLTPVTPGRTGWTLTGGTVLAARWGHRESTDLDLVVHPRTEIARLAKARNPAFWTAMEAAGATKIDLEGTPTVHFAKGKIELILTPPVPRIGAVEDTVESRRVQLMDPAQILTAKLQHRGTSAPVRDLYDLGVGRRTDPARAAIAVNATQERLLVAAITHWRKRSDRYRQEAQNDLQGVPEKFRDIQNEPSDHARRAVRDAKYHYLSVAASGHSVVVTTQNRNQLEQRVYEDDDKVNHHFERDGLNACLQARGWNPGRIRNEALNAKRAGRTETVLTIGELTVSGSGQSPPSRRQEHTPDRSRR